MCTICVTMETCIGMLYLCCYGNMYWYVIFVLLWKRVLVCTICVTMEMCIGVYYLCYYGNVYWCVLIVLLWKRVLVCYICVTMETCIGMLYLCCFGNVYWCVQFVLLWKRVLVCTICVAIETYIGVYYDTMFVAMERCIDEYYLCCYGNMYWCVLFHSRIYQGVRGVQPQMPAPTPRKSSNTLEKFQPPLIEWHFYEKKVLKVSQSIKTADFQQKLSRALPQPND